MIAVPRQYLEYEGIGFGSPSTRQKQYQNYRVQRASDKVIDHKTRQFGDHETSIAEPEKRAIRRSKYSKVIDRLVEDLIQEAMSKGEFQNLSGSGKPLKLEQELYVGRCNDQCHNNLQKDSEDLSQLMCHSCPSPEEKTERDSAASLWGRDVD